MKFECFLWGLSMQVFTKIISILLLAISLSACQEVAAFRSAIAAHGEDAADQALETHIWGVCIGSSVGAVNRRFNTSAEIDAYRRFCPSNLVTPNNE